MEKLCYDDFLNNIRDKVALEMGSGCNVSLKHILKNNSVGLDGILIREGEDAAFPSIYLNDFYPEYCGGTSLKDIAQRIICVYNESRRLEISKDILTQNFEHLSELVIYRLVNREKNALFLKTVPHIEFMDLAVTFHIVAMETDHSVGTITVTNEHCRKWGVDLKTLYEHASVNTPLLCPPALRRMEDVIHDILFARKLQEGCVRPAAAANLIGGEYDRENERFMYVLTNRQNVGGSAVLLYPDIIEGLKCHLGEEVCILPSSVHELILVPSAGEAQMHTLKEMVREINSTQVAAEEVLSDNAYDFCTVWDELISLKEKTVKA